MRELLFYTTAGCHLCDEARALLEAEPGLGACVRPVEIAEDGGLMERYGVRIPVLAEPGRGVELAWPFDAEALRAFLRG